MCRDIKRQREEKEHTQVSCCVGSGLSCCLLRGVVLQSSLLAPSLDLTTDITSRGPVTNSPRSNGRKRAGEGSGLGLLVGGCVVLYFSERSGLEAQVISWGPESLSGRSWRLEKCYVLGVVGSLKKTKSKNSNIRPTTCYCLSTLVVW